MANFNWRASPIAARVLPFAVFLLLTFCQDYFGEAGRYWFYLGKTLVGAAFLWMMHAVVQEMRWKVSWEGVVAGVVVFIIWVGLDPLLISLGLENSYPKLKASATVWNPHLHFGPALAWTFVIARIIGSTFIVPPLEEVFFRSFVYRYIANQDFLSTPLNRYLPGPFIITCIIFGVEHREWLAGVLAGAIYQGLVLWKNRLGDAITGHAVTNFLLSMWVVSRQAWQFW